MRRNNEVAKQSRNALKEQRSSATPKERIQEEREDERVATLVWLVRYRNGNGGLFV